MIKMGFWETAGKFAKATGEYLEKEREAYMRRIKDRIRTATDEQVLRAMNNAEEQFARDFAYDEAKRRNLI